MKLTLAFLAALAAADAAEARNHRQARRAYGEYGAAQPSTGGSYGGGSYPEVPKPAETPSPAVSSVEAPTYNQSSAPAFATSSPPNAASSYPPIEATPSPSPPVETPQVPEGAESSSILIPVETPKSSAPPAASDYGNGYPAQSTHVPAGAVPSGGVPSGAVPSGGVPSGAVPSGGYNAPKSSSLPVEAATSSAHGPTGVVGVPSGASTTPMSDLVTKTIYSTKIYSASSAMVTSVVAVGTTCIPKDEADKTPSPSAPVQTSKVPYSEVVKTLTETLVYTIGIGSTAHPVTTKVTSTSTQTLYKTIIVTPSVPEKSAYPQGGNGNGYPEGPTGTSTIKSTTTSTKYITVRPTPTPAGEVPSNKENSPNGGKPEAPLGGAGKPSGNGEDCPVPSTVTVTQKETVYVTAPAGGAYKPTATPASGVPSKPEGEHPVGGKPEVPAGGVGKPTPSGKYPIGNNGTNPYPVGPTGFMTATKPVGTEVPSKSSSLPAFSFVSDVPAPTPAVSKTPSAETQAPASSPAPVYPPAGGNGGYGAQPPAPSSTSSAKPVETPSNGNAYPSPAPPAPAGSYGSGY